MTVERWIASVDLGVGENGKRRRKRITGPTRKAVADKLRELQRQPDAGVDVRKKSITVADLASSRCEPVSPSRHRCLMTRLFLFWNMP